MGNELSVYQQVHNPLDFAMQFGSEIAKSKMFGCQNESQGRVLAMACLAEGKNPIAIARTHHIIDGNLSMRADAMLAEFNAIGGKHEIVSRTTDLATVTLSIDGETYTESLSWEEAQQEPYPFKSDGELKKNWATPRARRQMLWARVISEGVRTLRPGIVAGCYAPEEIQDFSDRREFTVNQQGHYEPAAEPTIITVDEAEIQTPGQSTLEQRNEIKELFSALNASENDIHAILQKRGAQAFHQLTEESAADLIEKLRSRLGGHSEVPETATSVDLAGPVDGATVEHIKRLMAGDPELVGTVKSHLHKNGKQKLADLTLADAELLKNCLEAKSMEAFFAKSLEGGSPPFEATTSS